MDRTVLKCILQLNRGEKAAIATIISSQGSTPRKPGAQVLFLQDGQTIGTIGGGSGEAEIRLHALQVISAGKARLVNVNLTHEIAEDNGMVCGGRMEIYIEPLGDYFAD